MPQNVTIGAFVFGAVLVLIALLPGGFKIFGVEISGTTGRLRRITAGVLGILLVVVGLYGYFFPRPDPSAVLRRDGGAQSVPLAFENRLTEPILVYWIDQGKEVLYQEMSPGEIYHVNTYATHQWRVRNKKTGAEIKTVVAESTGGTVTITSSRAGFVSKLGLASI